MSEENDTIRDEFLSDQGFRILRIKAIDIKDNLEVVLDDIVSCFRS